MKDLELLIGKALFTCVLISIIIVFVGAAIYCSQHAHDVVNFSVAQTGYHFNLMNILTNVLHGDALSIIQLGLLLIILSQVLRVLLTALIFIKQKDWTFMVISMLVLILMSVQLI